MDRQLAKALRGVLQAHLDKLQGQGTVEVLGAKFDSTSVTFQVKVTPGGAAALADKAKAEWDRYAAVLGLKPEHFGAEFRQGARSYRIVRLDLGKSRFPIIAERLPDGKRFKFEPEAVVRALGASQHRGSEDASERERAH